MVVPLVTNDPRREVRCVVRPHSPSRTLTRASRWTSPWDSSSGEGCKGPRPLSYRTSFTSHLYIRVCPRGRAYLMRALRKSRYIFFTPVHSTTRIESGATYFRVPQDLSPLHFFTCQPHLAERLFDAVHDERSPTKGVSFSQIPYSH